ncbi:hypothetical protein HELRODRAFT_168135 [Helobdella robusta]|uniref:Uncharacterized protein n=1 Tax=Helobdella robusta TaxID=6412 RepID=T1F076_HELRO|nr:hypothetical protein HELRODRAFT_168135 [Helobdella robusta]ESO10245.1 hypothetical protein HELRODRAFT_168135 [Helobdella robusta]
MALSIRQKRVRRISGDPVDGVVVQGPVDGLATGTPLYSVAVQGTIDGRTTCRPRGWRFGTWNDTFTFEDFSSMSPSTAYQVFKAKSSYPLHLAIRMQREDVVFLFMIEFHSQLPEKLNEMDELGDLPIDLALMTKQEGILNILIEHGVDVDRPDDLGHCLLHKAINRGTSVFF